MRVEAGARDVVLDYISNLLKTLIKLSKLHGDGGLLKRRQDALPGPYDKSANRYLQPLGIAREDRSAT
eukprot:scaffold3756_cov175-Prasinococcus_capsulatus_cf.AAC.1